MALFHPIGSPLQFYVDYVNSGHVTAYGPGLIHGVVNKPAVFTVNTKDAGEGKLPYVNSMESATKARNVPGSLQVCLSHIKWAGHVHFCSSVQGLKTGRGKVAAWL